MYVAVLSARTGTADPSSMDPYAAPDSMNQLAMSMPINEQQLAAANTHLYSIQTMSGAQVQVCVAGDELHRQLGKE